MSDSTRSGLSVDYYFTPVSPWTYLGHPRFAAITSLHSVKVNIKPCDLGRVFSASGGLPLKQRSQQRQDYRLLELKRWSSHLGTRLNLHPKHFPTPADAASQMIIAADATYDTGSALALAFALMRACWADERNINDEPTLEAIVREIGLEPGRLMTPEAKAAAKLKYDANTQAAVEQNVFGAPWYVFDGEAYWGQDRLDFLERAFAAKHKNA